MELLELGIANLSVVPVRREPKHASEQVTQLLFGEGYRVLDQADRWLHIQSLIDGYVGWIDQKQYAPLSEQLPDTYQKGLYRIATEPNLIWKDHRNGDIQISLGSFLIPNEHERIWVTSGTSKPEKRQERPFLLQFARKFLGAPYLWGGRSQWGIDCSALTQLAYASIGIDIPRDSSDQVAFGQAFDLDKALPGDLAFFAEEEKLDHVGLVLSDNEVLHASGYVRIDTLTTEGILLEAEERLSHKLLTIKRVLPAF